MHFKLVVDSTGFSVVYCRPPGCARCDIEYLDKRCSPWFLVVWVMKTNPCHQSVLYSHGISFHRHSAEATFSINRFVKYQGLCKSYVISSFVMLLQQSLIGIMSGSTNTWIVWLLCPRPIGYMKTCPILLRKMASLIYITSPDALRWAPRSAKNISIRS